MQVSLKINEKNEVLKSTCSPNKLKDKTEMITYMKILKEEKHSRTKQFGEN